jgi:hypothetical protein
MVSGRKVVRVRCVHRERSREGTFTSEASRASHGAARCRVARCRVARRAAGTLAMKPSRDTFAAKPGHDGSRFAPKVTRGTFDAKPRAVRSP